MISREYLLKLQEAGVLTHVGMIEFLSRYESQDFTKPFTYNQFIYDIWDDFVFFTKTTPSYDAVIKKSGEPFTISIKENPDYEKFGGEMSLTLVKPLVLRCPICRTITKISVIQMMSNYTKSLTWCPECSKALVHIRKNEEEKDILRLNDISDESITKTKKLVLDQQTNKPIIINKTEEDLRQEEESSKKQQTQEKIINKISGKANKYENAIPHSLYENDD